MCSDEITPKRASREAVAKALKLCAVTDRFWIERANQTAAKPFTIEDQVAEAIAGGATMIQIREKDADTREFVELARRVKEVTGKLGIPLIVNDSLEVAIASGADGLHVGQDDGDIARIRARLANGEILGVTVHTAREAREAELAGADYVGVGAAFPTGSKDDVSVLSLEAFREIAEAVSIPAVAIGGITAEKAHLLTGCGLAGIAAISAVFAEPDRVRAATERLAAAASKVAPSPAHRETE